MIYTNPTAEAEAAATAEAKRNARRFPHGTAGACCVCGKAVSNTAVYSLAVDSTGHPIPRTTKLDGSEEWLVIGANCYRNQDLKKFHGGA